MSKTIAINAGSSSLKWQLYQMPEETVVAKGICLLYTSPSPRDGLLSRMPSSA